MKKNLSSLWSPDEETKKKSKLELFCRHLEKKKFLKYRLNFKHIWEWSIKEPEIFWSEIWNFTKIKGLKGKKILKRNKIFYKNIFFPDSKLNYAENLLPKRNEEIAIKRYQTYEKTTEPVIEHYKKLNLLKVVDGERSIEQINKEISDLIDLI